LFSTSCCHGNHCHQDTFYPLVHTMLVGLMPRPPGCGRISITILCSRLSWSLHLPWYRSNPPVTMMRWN
jgi:hypothetical protein